MLTLMAQVVGRLARGAGLLGVAVAMLVACSDSGSDGTTGAGGSAGSAGTAGSAGSSSGGDAGQAGSGGTAGSGGASGSGGAAGSTGGTGDECSQTSVVRKYDDFDDGGEVGFQGGFAANDCWAVVYDGLDCPYMLDKITVLIGGEATSREFSVQLWDVDADGAPKSELQTASFTVTGANDALNELDATPLNVAGFQEAKFAVAVCHLESGLPSIARDSGGITAGVNWIRSGSTWEKAEDFMLPGDWIMRTTLRPK